MKTNAIVLAIQRHRDTSSIVHLYTQETGRMQALVYGKKKISMLTPLSIVEVSLSIKPSRPFSTLQDVSLIYIPIRLNQDVQRQSIALFIAEALYKTMKLPMQDIPLFNALVEDIKELDMADSVAHIPHQFLHRLSELLGYGGEPIEELSDMKSWELVNVIIG